MDLGSMIYLSNRVKKLYSYKHTAFTFEEYIHKHQQSKSPVL